MHNPVYGKFVQKHCMQDICETNRAHFAYTRPGLKFFIILLLSILFFAGCSATDNIDFDLTSKTTYYADTSVVRSPPEVHVYPVTEVGGLKVIFVPFRVVQKMDQPEMAGYSLAKTFWQTWSGMQVFNQFEFMPEAGPFRRDMAVAYARTRGADMVVGGFVTHLFAGGSSSPNRLTLQVEAYDVSSGLLVWSMSQGGMLPGPSKQDYIIMDVKNRQPTDPLFVICKTLAADMGAIMYNWSHGETGRSSGTEAE